MNIVAPSILSCDFMKLKDQIEMINKSKAEWLHFDVMDGHFVPNISFGPDIFKYFKDNSPLFMDVHIMVSNPKFIGDLFIKAGADQIVFHYEACQDDEERISVINHFRKQGIKVGMAIKPKTNADSLRLFLNKLDLVLVMSVEPGFGGQAFMPEAIDKVKYLASKREKYDFKYLIQIDGGISDSNKELCYDVGVDCLVAGSYLFKQEDFSKAVESLL